MTEDALWKLFQKTGLPECYTLYRREREKTAKKEDRAQRSRR